MAETKKPAAKKAAPAKEAPVEEAAVRTPGQKTRLEKKYREEVVPALVKEFSYRNVMMAPRLEKIVINMGVGDATTNSKADRKSVV